MIQIRDIPGFDGKYVAGSDGAIYSAWNSRHVPRDDLYRLKTRITKFGYECVQLRIAGKSKNFLVHRLIAMTFIGPSDMEVNHTDGVKTNNEASNLEYMTRKENVRHAMRLGLRNHARGDRCARTVLDASVINDIRSEVKKLRANGRAPYGSMSKLAKKYGVTPSALTGIADGHSWKHIQPE